MGAGGQGMNPRERQQPHATQLETVGVTIYFRAPPDAKISVKLEKGQDLTFRLAGVPEIKSIRPFAAVDLRRSPVASQITDSANENDFPPSPPAAIPSGWPGRATAQGRDQFSCAATGNGKWGEPLTVTEKPGDIFMTGVAAAGGKAMVVWSDA